MSRRFLTTSVLIAGGGVGYYLYTAGGDPKVAQKMAEHDASSASKKIKSELPGSEKEAKKQGEKQAITHASLNVIADYPKEWSARAGKQIDDTVADARAKGKELNSKLDQKIDDLRKGANQSIDQFDKTVEKKTAEAKSGVSSWFGGGK